MNSRCKILVVEDDDSIRTTLKLGLELEDYDVATAANGLQALQLLARSQVPCVILLDLMMPIMNGWEFLDQAQADPRLDQIPVLIVSAFAEEARKLPSQGVIRKPIDFDVLLREVGQHCPRRELPMAASG